MRTGIRTSALLATLASLSCPSAWAVTPAQPAYTIHLIPVPSNATALVPAAINATGQVTGSIQFANQVAHAFLYTYSTAILTDLGTLTYPGTTVLGGAAGLSINDSGALVGTYGDQAGQTWSYGFQYSAGVLTALAGAPGYPNCIATGINDAGTIVGGCQSLNGSFAAVYSNGVPQPVGPTGGLGGAVNVYGQIAAYGASSAFIYNAGVATTLPPLAQGTPPPVPTAINNAGQVVGSQLLNGTYTSFLYSNGATAALAQVQPSTVQSAVSINNAGSIVGSTVATAGAVATPFLIYAGNVYDINALISPQDPNQPYVTILNAYQISDPGWILVTGIDSRTQVTGVYVLIPTAVLPVDAALIVPSTAVQGTPFTVAWTDQSATSCSAAGGSSGDGWSGSLSVQGGQQQVTEAAVGTVDYSLTCSSTLGSVTATAKVAVTTNATPGLSGSGGGALDLRTLAVLLMLGAWRALRTAAGQLTAPRATRRYWSPRRSSLPGAPGPGPAASR